MLYYHIRNLNLQLKTAVIWLTYYFLNQSKQYVLPESQAFEKHISFHELWDQEFSADSGFSETFAWESIVELLDNAQKQLPPT